MTRATNPNACTCAVLRGASRRLSRRYDSALAPLGLSLNQYSIMSRLDHMGSADIGTLADMLVMDRSTLGHLIRPLAAKSWLETTTDARDRRRSVLGLAPDGRTVLAAARPIVDAEQAALEAALGAVDAALLVSLLDRVSALG